MTIIGIILSQFGYAKVPKEATILAYEVRMKAEAIAMVAPCEMTTSLVDGAKALEGLLRSLRQLTYSGRRGGYPA